MNKRCGDPVVSISRWKDPTKMDLESVYLEMNQKLYIWFCNRDDVSEGTDGCHRERTSQLSTHGTTTSQ